MRWIGRFAPLFLVPILAGCAFSKLGDDLDRLKTEAYLFSGNVESDILELHSTIVVSLRDPAADEIISFRLLGSDNRFEFRQMKEPHWFFAFADLNKDLRFQSDEPYGWAADGGVVTPVESETPDIDIRITRGEQVAYPERLVDEALVDHLDTFARLHLGSISSLDDPLFSSQQGRKGLWQPFAFWEDGGTGVHFLQPFDSERVPVLFVHGINGSPKDFASMIARLDTTRYQAWFVSYPSGLRLTWLAQGMFDFLEVLQLRYGFQDMHLVAHSMGGLVLRGALNLCTQHSACGYVRSFTSISTPWNGVEAAEEGVKYAPAVIPVWRDLYPDSNFVATLFDTPMPDGIPHYLLFGFRQDSFRSSGSSDGVILLNSQLRTEAQKQATVQRGFDEGHLSILHNDIVIGNVLRLIEYADR